MANVTTHTSTTLHQEAPLTTHYDEGCLWDKIWPLVDGHGRYMWKVALHYITKYMNKKDITFSPEVVGILERFLVKEEKDLPTSWMKQRFHPAQKLDWITPEVINDIHWIQKKFLKVAPTTEWTVHSLSEFMDIVKPLVGITGVKGFVKTSAKNPPEHAAPGARSAGGKKPPKTPAVAGRPVVLNSRLTGRKIQFIIKTQSV